MNKHAIHTLSAMLCSLPLLALASPTQHPDHNSHDHHTPEGMAAHQQMMDASPGHPDNSTAKHLMSSGEVRKIDRQQGKMTLRHGPLTHLNMPAMTMVFDVTDRAWLDQFVPGDKVRFQVERINGQLTITDIEKQP